MNRKVILFVAASLDGYIARRDGSVDWLPRPSAAADFGHAEFWSDVGTVVMGRRTYDAAREHDGGASFGGRRCIVFSRRRAGTRDRFARFVAADPAEFVRELRTKSGRGRNENGDRIWLVGGGEIVRACLEAGVVNEIVLSIVPVLLGDGVPLFLPRGGTTWLELQRTRSFANGLVQLAYATGVRRAAGDDPMDEPGAGAAEAAEAAHHESVRVTATAVGSGMIRAWAVRQHAA